MAGSGSPIALAEMPVDRLSSFVWWFLTRNASKESDIAKIKARLWQPPSGYRGKIDARSPWSPENETKALASLKASLGLGAGEGSGGNGGGEKITGLRKSTAPPRARPIPRRSRGGR